MIASARRLAAVLVFTASSAAAAIGVPVAGHVRDQAGQPIAGATVSIVELKRGALTDADGKFELADVPPGSYTLAVRHLSYAKSAQRITVSASPLTVDVALELGAIV